MKPKTYRYKALSVAEAEKMIDELTSSSTPITLYIRVKKKKK